MPQETSFKVITQPLENGVMLLELFGEVDLLASPKIKEVIISFVRDRQQKVIISLEKVGYIDSSGLGVLLGALKKIREINGHICIVCNNPQIIKIFDITGLANVFDICKCREEGMETLASATCISDEQSQPVSWYGGERYRRVKT